MSKCFVIIMSLLTHDLRLVSKNCIECILIKYLKFLEIVFSCVHFCSK